MDVQIPNHKGVFSSRGNFCQGFQVLEEFDVVAASPKSSDFYGIAEPNDLRKIERKAQFREKRLDCVLHDRKLA